MQIYEIESVPPDDLGYAPVNVLDALKNASFIQASIRLHSQLGTEVPLSAPQLKEIITQQLDRELTPGSCETFYAHAAIHLHPSSVDGIRIEARR